MVAIAVLGDGIMATIASHEADKAVAICCYGSCLKQNAYMHRSSVPYMIIVLQYLVHTL